MGISFIKTGKESASLAQKAALEAEMRKESQGKLWKFFLKESEECKLTFVDGDLSPEGYLVPPRWYEHTIYTAGEWTTFICPEKTLPDSKDKCPICETGDRPSIVAAFTVIDHRSYTSDKGVTYKDRRKLLIAKPKTFEMLNKIAVKRNGLAGATFDVSRSSKKDPSVGSLFDFVEKRPLTELKKLYVHKFKDAKTNEEKLVEDFVVADYENEYVFRTGEELRKLGLGVPSTMSSLNQSTTTALPAADYSNEL